MPEASLVFSEKLAGGHPEICLQASTAAGDALIQLEQEGHAFGVGVFAEKQCPRFNFVPVKTHLTPMKLSLDVNGKFLFISVK
jgi:hypothetical protein